MRERVDWSREVTAADWLVSRLHPLGQDIGSLVPDGFAAYLRILHPAWRDTTKIRWSELARGAGVELTPSMSYQQIDGGRALTMRPPDLGTVAPDELAALVAALSRHTTRADRCWFCVWDGYGWMTGPPAVAALSGSGDAATPSFVDDVPTERVQLPGRTFMLYQGSIADAEYLCREPYWQTPNLWWPADHAWCVSSDIDLRSTYIGGSAALTDELAADARLEVARVRAEDPIAA